MSEEKITQAQSEQVSTVADYRKMLSTVKTVKLPSGLLFQIRRLTLLDYLNEGVADLPNELYKFMANMAIGKIPKNEEEKHILDGKQGIRRKMGPAHHNVS